MKRYLLLFLPVMLQLSVMAQNGGGRVMTSFIPKSGAYDIYYPKSFVLKEDTAGIVTMSDTSSELNINISAFLADTTINDEKVISKMTGFLTGYFGREIKRADWNSYKSKFDALVELKISDTATNWVWYGIANKKGLMVLSVDKKKSITKDEMNLVQYMINSLVISQ